MIPTKFEVNTTKLDDGRHILDITVPSPYLLDSIRINGEEIDFRKRRIASLTLKLLPDEPTKIIVEEYIKDME